MTITDEDNGKSYYPSQKFSNLLKFLLADETIYDEPDVIDAVPEHDPSLDVDFDENDFGDDDIDIAEALM